MNEFLPNIDMLKISECSRGGAIGVCLICQAVVIEGTSFTLSEVALAWDKHLADEARKKKEPLKTGWPKAWEDGI